MNEYREQTWTWMMEHISRLSDELIAARKEIQELHREIFNNLEEISGLKLSLLETRSELSTAKEMKF